MKPENHKNIWLFAEHKHEKLMPVFQELLTKAKCLANEIENCKLCALIIGSSLENVVKEAEESGADIVYYVDDEKLLNYNCESYTTVLEGIINEYKPLAFLFGATSMGAELAPSLSARVKTGLAAHCVDITTDKHGTLTFIVPAFGGKIECEILIPNHRPQMATVRPGIFEANKLSKANNVQTFRLECPVLPEPRISFVSFIPSKDYTVQKLEESALVIGCGRGVGTDNDFENLKKLAKKLNAAIAFTRPAVDMGWASDEREMVGSSGKSISPTVYLGFGISGATHHLSGINKSRIIISVNKNKKAKMFDASDYKVVAESRAVINALLKAL
ncbi:MAG: electron transfer flavoprotein subunit alpha/FixB family protein [Spirochaetes bacterium]|nr:electron transfer flavoprotein subunit alpha/FixB family protein [Spirochaetota bacterium]